MAEKNELNKLAELRALLERRIKKIEAELDGLRVLLNFVDSSLLNKGFKRAKLSKSVPQQSEVILDYPDRLAADFASSSVLEREQAIPIKTTTGELLANIYIEENYMRVVLAENKHFKIDIPPFMVFLVDRVLVKMQEKDREAAEKGEIAHEKILNYDIVRDGDFIREIVIRNIDPDRARELKSTIRWTLEKMYEKVKSDL